MRHRLFFLAVWALLSGLGGTWALAMPLFAGPDEPAHVLEAAGVVRGDALGRTESRPPPFTTVTIVDVPRYLTNAQQLPTCFAFKPAVTASCQPPMATGDRDTAVETLVGRYPPLYYAAVGLPTLVLDGPRAVYAMRAVSAVIGGFVLAVGVLLLRASSVPRFALLGAAVAVTPMALFLTGVVNPSGLEIAAGFTAWAALLPLALDPEPQLIRTRLGVGALSLAVLMNVRPSSPLWALLIVLTVALVMPVPRWRLLLGQRRWVPPVTIGIMASLIAVTWTVIADPSRSLGGFPTPEFTDPWQVVGAALGQTPFYLRQLIGYYSWLDTAPSFLTTAVWTMAIGTLLVLALALGSARQRSALLLLAVSVVILPLALQIPTGARVGLIWQGRYILPLAVGVVLLAALVLGSAARSVLPLAGLDVVVLPGLLIAAVVSFYWALRRFTVGVDGPYLSVSGSWSPPFGVLLLVVFQAVLYSAFVAVLLIAGRVHPAGRDRTGATSHGEQGDGWTDLSGSEPAST